MTKAIFYVSDSTAITAKALGQSLLSQFNHLYFTEHLRPYINTKERLQELIDEIDLVSQKDNSLPIVFASMMDEHLMATLTARVSGVIDIFSPFMLTLEGLLKEKSSRRVGQAHKAADSVSYQKRIEAIDYTLAADDGLRLSDYHQADIILLGVSRSGKTPTALYLALNFALKVANYPFTSEDLPSFVLKSEHKENIHKLVGLIISPERLQSIRKERRALGHYADINHIMAELLALKKLFEHEGIPQIDTTTKSVEEIASLIIEIHTHQQKIKARS